MTFEAFKDLYDTMNQTLDKCLEFDNAMEKVIGSDTTSMLCWPIDNVSHVVSIALIAAGATESEADLFVYDLKDQLEQPGGTEIGIRESTQEDFLYYSIESLEDYYTFLFGDLSKLKTSKESKFKGADAVSNGFVHFDEHGLEVTREN